MKGLSEFEADGAADIWIQVAKLSEDSCKLPEQVVLSVFVVIVLVDIVLLNVTATLVDTETSVELSVGEIEETVGTVFSVVVLLSVVELDALLSSVSEAQLLSKNESNIVRFIKTNKYLFL